MKEKYYSVNRAVLQTKDKIILFSIFVISIFSVFAGYYVYTRIIYKQEVDLFKYVDVEINGISDEASANVKILDENDELTRSINYSLSKQSNIANGDVIILTATPDEKYMESKRLLAKIFTKQYAVSGLSYFANNKNDIGNNVLETIANESNENVKNAFLSTYDNASDIQIKNISYYYRNSDEAKSRLSICTVTEVDFNVKYLFNTITVPNTVYYLSLYSDFLIKSDKTIDKYNAVKEYQNQLFYLPLMFKQELNSNGFVELKT